MNKDYLKELKELNEKYGINPPNPVDFKEEMVEYSERVELNISEDEIPFDIDKMAILSQQIHVTATMLDIDISDFKEGVSWILGDVIS